ncbi:MAG: ribokinase [Bacteroidia bacterium]
MKKLVVVGSSNTDMVVKTDRFPVPGETILGGDFFMFPGGKGANQAVSAARLGGNVAFMCALGDDLFGRQALKNYENEGIDTALVQTTPGAASGVALITVNAEGENQIVVAPGTNALLEVSWLEKHFEALQAADLLLTQLETPLPSVSFLAQHFGEKLILNPAPAALLPSAVYQNLYLITPNQTEASLLTGIPVKDLPSAADACQILLKKGCQAVILTMGAAGAYYADSQQTFHIPAPQVHAVDSTAAGDVFNGALAVALLENQDIKEAIRFACQAAAFSVQKMGAQASAPYRHQL